MLVFPVSDVPELPRGKGNKLFDIPGKKAASRDEYVSAITVVPPGTDLLVWSGDRKMTIDAKDLKGYRGQRAQRGSVLPRGWRSVDRIEPAPAEAPAEKPK
jgi:topoisomerase-4 subunit A